MWHGSFCVAGYLSLFTFSFNVHRCVWFVWTLGEGARFINLCLTFMECADRLKKDLQGPADKRMSPPLHG